MSSLTETVDQANNNHFVQKYPLSSFFLLAFGLTWIFLITDALGSHGVFPFRLPLPLLILTGYMPTLASILVTGLTKGKAGIRVLLGKLLIWRVGFKWYLLAVFGFAILCVLSIWLFNLIGESPALPIFSRDTPQFSSPIVMFFNIALLFMIVGLVNGEELAWRGFALPRLQARYNALTSSLILGVLWTLFHLPLFFTLTGTSQADMSFVSFLISTVSLTVLFTWMYNNTKGSVLMAYLLHAATNTWSRVFSIDHANAQVGWILAGLLAIAALLVVTSAGAEHLSRKTTRIQE